MKRYYLPLVLLVFVANAGCKGDKMQLFPSTDPRLAWQGRTWKDTTGNTYLVGSASSLKFAFSGDRCSIRIQNAAQQGEYNYISIFIDGSRQPRTAIRYETLTPIEIVPDQKSSTHLIEVYKETEAANGAVIIGAIEADSLVQMPAITKKRIEFIGNSITVGMSSDASAIACEAGTWYDQHNAYDAFGPRVARALDMEYVLSGFSGIGIYRNTRTDRPVMADIYTSAFLSPDPNSPRHDFKKFVPDIVSICLGTNDFSAGDGTTPRAPFDPAQFIPAYVDFISTVHGFYKDAQIIITNTPMLNTQQNEILMACLQQIKTQAETSIPGLKPMYIFSFSHVYQSGCLGHPSLEEHGKMAEEMILFLKGI
ncbi:MAG: GDSL-type esterase/lipase family protein [Saprospiraceae bacterium]|nr:GDSL-type esterase/lipase family protein [Saprospiraceae bacterium]